MLISTGSALAVFGWEGVAKEDAGVNATRAECSARSDAAWRLVKPSSRAILLGGGIVDGQKRVEKEEGVVAVAVSLLFDRILSALTSSELDHGFKNTVTCSARSLSFRRGVVKQNRSAPATPGLRTPTAFDPAYSRVGPHPGSLRG